MTRQVTTIPVKELPVAIGNWDTTRAPIDRIVIHTMVGTINSAAARFNTKNQAAAHYGVGLDGSLVHWVDEDNTAYHAGDYPMNQRSIGIEHEDNGDYNGTRTDALYTASAALVKDICAFYNIPIDRDHIKKHNEVSDHPTGCPDGLDIDRIVREASGAIIAQPIAQEITDQTKIPQIDNMEVQAIRSLVNDLRRDNSDLHAKELTAAGDYLQLQQQLQDCQNKPAEAPQAPKTYTTQLGKLFARLAESFG